MLLVDDHEPEPLERDALLDERVRPDHDARAPLGDRGPRGALGLAARRRADQRDLDAAPLEPAPRACGACCSARISVGAIRAAWYPDWTASIIAAKATAVFPLPTSPWSSRFIGSGRPMSRAISPSARSWAPVSVNGSREIARDTAAGEASKAIPALGADAAPAPGERELQEEQLLEDEPPERGRRARRREGEVGAGAAGSAPRGAPAPGRAARGGRARRAGRSSGTSGASSSTSRFISFRSAACW